MFLLVKFNVLFIIMMVSVKSAWISLPRHSKSIYCPSRDTLEDLGNSSYCPAICEKAIILTPPPKTPGKGISEQKCEEYVLAVSGRIQEEKSQDFCLEQSNLRNLPTLDSIFDDDKRPKPGEFPHMGAIGWNKPDDDWIFLCGCSIISPKFVLTAGHCTDAGNDTRVAKSVPEVIIFIGNAHYRPRNDNDVNLRYIDRIISHPEYETPNKYNDIALMELKKPLSFSRNIQPACLWPRHSTELIGKNTYATGWNIDEERFYPNLQIVTTEIIEFEECNVLLKPSFNRLWPSLRNTQICARKIDGVMDACQGDSGSPLQIRIPLNDVTEGAMHYVIGVTSFGVGCGLNDTPGVYTRVAPYLDWIENIVWK